MTEFYPKKQTPEEVAEGLRNAFKQAIKDEIEAAKIDGMEHGAWGWAEQNLDEGWKTFIDSFNGE